MFEGENFAIYLFTQNVGKTFVNKKRWLEISREKPPWLKIIENPQKLPLKIVYWIHFSDTALSICSIDLISLLRSFHFRVYWIVV